MDKKIIGALVGTSVAGLVTAAGVLYNTRKKGNNIEKENIVQNETKSYSENAHEMPVGN